MLCSLVKQYISFRGWTTVMLFVQIQRIENATLYDLYSVRRSHMLGEAKPAADAEKLLWHGTSATVADKICIRGFNRSFCGKNGEVFSFYCLKMTCYLNYVMR